MKRVYKIVIMMLLISINAIADDNMIDKVKNITMPLYEEKTFGDLANLLEDSKWGIKNNIVELSGFFYYNPRKKRGKVYLKYTITLDDHNAIAKMTLVDYVYKKDEIGKVHRWEYEPNKWSGTKWQSYLSYQNEPNMRPRYDTNESIRFFKEQFYPIIFK